MDKDRIAGAAKQAQGGIKKTVGKALGDPKLVVEGNSDEVEGKLRSAVGGMKDAMRDALKK